MIPGFTRGDDLAAPPPPHPQTVVRHSLVPPPDYLQTASAWRADLRPRRRWRTAATLLIVGAALVTSLLSCTEQPAEARIIPREAAR